MAIDPSSLTPSNFRVGPTIQATSCSAPLDMGMIQRGLGNGMLNASRTSIDQFRTRGVHNDDPVFLVGQRNLPKMGYQPLDKAIDKFADAADYLPQATQDAMTTALRWGLGASAGVCSATILTQLLLKSRGILVKAANKDMQTWLMVAIPIGLGTLAGTAAAIGGFSYSFFQNFRDFHMHAAKTSLEQKTPPKA